MTLCYYFDRYLFYREIEVNKMVFVFSNILTFCSCSLVFANSNSSLMRSQLSLRSLFLCKPWVFINWLLSRLFLYFQHFWCDLATVLSVLVSLRFFVLWAHPSHITCEKLSCYFFILFCIFFFLFFQHSNYLPIKLLDVFP